jgi:SAM-dependent methyltransferase
MAMLFAAVPAMAQGDEVPFVVTPDNVTREMLRLADVKRRDFVIDLGSGDGRIVITAAKVHRARGLGVEIVPELVERSRLYARRAGVADHTEFRVQDLFATDLSRATVITMYLLAEVNLQLRPRLLALKPGTRIVSHDWDMGDWKPDRTVTVEAPGKSVGLEKRSRLHLWIVPARIEGRWCGRPGQVLDVTQQYQRARLDFGGALPAIDSTLQGTRLHAGNSLSMNVVEGARRQLQVASATGAWATLAGARFMPALGAECKP